MKVSENMSYISPDSCTRYRIVQDFIQSVEKNGFKRSHFNAVKPTDMLQNSDFTYSCWAVGTLQSVL
jgi:hypothetical protein